MNPLEYHKTVSTLMKEITQQYKESTQLAEYVQNFNVKQYVL